ncbi:MAG: hypothetical protein NT166_28855 [Candidatus Aminicenantes bacterium]|nr:hypothetical protein [Candidatus Aminicenantes bacterium]
MRIEKDFKEFIELLNYNKVKYLVVGGFAIAFHATARFTKDIDIITSISGVEFESAWKTKAEGKYGDVPCFFISNEDLIKNKQASGRPQDLADIKILEKIKIISNRKQARGAGNKPRQYGKI